MYVDRGLTISGGGQLVVTCDVLGCIRGASSAHQIYTGTGTGPSPLITTVVSGLLNISLPSIDHTVTMSSLTVRAQSGYSGLLNILSGAVTVNGSLTITDRPISPLDTVGSVVVYDAIDPNSLATDHHRPLATLNVLGTVSVAAGAVFRI